MKKTVSRQNTNDSTRVHGMYGSMHTDIFEGMGLRGINLSTDDREKNHEVRSNKRKNTGRKALTRAIAAESPLSMGYAVELERFGRGLGAGVKRSGTASAEALRRSASRYRTKAEEAGTSLRALGKLFSIRNLILMLFAALTISAALILMLFNFEKAVVRAIGGGALTKLKPTDLIKNVSGAMKALKLGNDYLGYKWEVADAQL